MPTILISFASWEPRFVLGVAHLIEKGGVDKCVVIYATEYATRTAPNRDELRNVAKKHNVELSEIPIVLETSIASWKQLAQELPPHLTGDIDVLFDISTAPREPLWYVLHILDALGCNSQWIYHHPRGYAEDWLSRNAQSPRLILKRSGIALPGKKTCIIALAGFDHERLAQLIERYEPMKCFVGRQTGNQLGNASRNTGFNEAFVNQKEIEIFDFDCYDASSEAVQSLLKRLPMDIWEKYNVIGVALGPKPSAITMFKLTQIHPEMGLVYIPSGEYNPEYSSDIDLNKTSCGAINELVPLVLEESMFIQPSVPSTAHGADNLPA